MSFKRRLSMLLLSGFTTSTSNLRPYVSPPELLPAGVAAGAPEILPGIVVVVAEASQDGFLSGFVPRSAMREIAIQNLRKLPLPTFTKSVSVEGRTDGDIFLFEQQDSFVAARITFLDELAAREAFGRPAEPWEIANVIVFLASEYSTYMTGEIVSVSSQRA